MTSPLEDLGRGGRAPRVVVISFRSASIIAGLLLALGVLVAAALALFLFRTHGDAENPAALGNEEASSRSEANRPAEAGATGEKHERPGTLREKIELLEGVFAALPAGTEWAVAETERLAGEISAWAADHDGSPIAVSLECRGESLCRLLLDHRTREAALAIRRAAGLGGPFSWGGSQTSISAGDLVESDFGQLVFLVRKGYALRGGDIVEKGGGVTRGAPANGGRK